MDAWLMAQVMALAGGDDIHNVRGILACYQNACDACESVALSSLRSDELDGHRLHAALFERILRIYSVRRGAGELVRIRDVQQAVCRELLAEQATEPSSDTRSSNSAGGTHDRNHGHR